MEGLSVGCDNCPVNIGPASLSGVRGALLVIGDLVAQNPNGISVGSYHSDVSLASADLVRVQNTGTHQDAGMQVYLSGANVSIGAGTLEVQGAGNGSIGMQVTGNLIITGNPVFKTSTGGAGSISIYGATDVKLGQEPGELALVAGGGSQPGSVTIWAFSLLTPGKGSITINNGGLDLRPATSGASGSLDLQANKHVVVNGDLALSGQGGKISVGYDLATGGAFTVGQATAGSGVTGNVIVPGGVFNLKTKDLSNLTLNVVGTLSTAPSGLLTLIGSASQYSGPVGNVQINVGPTGKLDTSIVTTAQSLAINSLAASPPVSLSTTNVNSLLVNATGGVNLTGGVQVAGPVSITSSFFNTLPTGSLTASGPIVIDAVESFLGVVV